MTFASPGWLFAFAVLPLAVLGYLAGQRQRRARTAALAAFGLVSTGGGQRSWRRRLPIVLFLLALALLVLAAARPTATIRTPKRQATAVVAIDVSNSMAAKDVSPSRFSAAKATAAAFVRDQPSSVRVGVVAFGPGAVIVQPPTSDHDAALRAISHLSIGGGTSLSAGILTALDAIAGKTIKVNTKALNQDDSADINIGYFGASTIVLISDGEDTSQTNPVTVARLASTAGVHIQTIGVGTSAGTSVKIGGFTVATAENPQTLMNVAAVANGSFHQVGTPTAVADVSRSIDLHFTLVAQRTEISALFALAAALAIVIGALFSVAWFGRVL